MSTSTPTVQKDLELGPIEGRWQSLNATVDMLMAVPALQTRAGERLAMEATARCARDVPDLIAEIKRLRGER